MAGGANGTRCLTHVRSAGVDLSALNCGPVIVRSDRLVSALAASVASVDTIANNCERSDRGYTADWAGDSTLS